MRSENRVDCRYRMTTDVTSRQRNKEKREEKINHQFSDAEYMFDSLVGCELEASK